MNELLEERFSAVHDSGIRLETVGGLTLWEAQPVYRHQAALFRILKSARPSNSADDGCACVFVSDVSVRFPDASEKRPDIAVYCHEPPDSEQDSVITVMPEAVIDVISKGYEAKDYLVGVPFYLQNGIRDVVTLDPRSKEVRHYRPDGMTTFVSPVEITFECGCVCVV